MANTSHKLIGTQLGTCVIERLIGTGGMSVVYLARQLHPSRRVAVKVLRPLWAAPEEEQHFIARFRREADLVARLDHINIVPIYEYGKQQGLTYLVMPYLAGGSLRDMLVEHGPLSLQKTLRYIEQAAAALDYAHSQGIVHRDIKPSNFLFHTDGRLVLADFGIARMIGEQGSATGTTLTGSGHFMGSPEYMAPEMIRGKHVDHRTDIYELGIVLFQMLSGRVPFDGGTLFVVAAKHLEEKVPSLHQINPAIPREIDTIVRKALAKNPEDRFASAGEMARAFRQAIMLSTSLVDDDPDSTLVPAHPALHSYTPALHLHSTALMSAETEAVVEGGEEQVQEVAMDAAEVPTELMRAVAKVKHRPMGKRVPILILSSVFLLVLLSAGAFAVSPKILRPPKQPVVATVQPTPSPDKRARSLVEAYFYDINQSDYQSAYQLWGADQQSKQTYSNFASGFANTRRDDYVFHGTTLLSDGTVRVAITLYATNATAAGNEVDAFNIAYIVGQENGIWKLLSAQAQPQGIVTNLTPTQDEQNQAQGIVQRYYDAVNVFDYQTAYQLRGADLQSMMSYPDVVKGYATTKHVDVTYDAITRLSKNVFKVSVTLNATDEIQGKMVYSTFRGSYIIGQENGVWKIIGSNIEKVS